MRFRSPIGLAVLAAGMLPFLAGSDMIPGGRGRSAAKDVDLDRIDLDFKAKLTGAAEVPPVMTEATGVLKLELRLDPETHEAELRFKLDLEDIEGVTAAHIHWGAKGMNGPVIFLLFDVERDGEFNNPINGVLKKMDFMPVPGLETLKDAVDQMKGGYTYVNVHTLAYPDGEIRGQIKLVKAEEEEPEEDQAARPGS